MTLQPADEALARLQDVLSGRVQVPADMVPRLVQALVRRAGAEGEQALGLHIVREPDGRKAAQLIRAGAVLGDRLIPYLLEGLAKHPVLPRGLATVEVLGGMGSLRARDALAEIERANPHPAIRAAASARRSAIEQAHPARYRLLPRLLERGLEGPALRELGDELRACTDPELEGLLLEHWEHVPEPARALALEALAARGGERAFAFLQERYLAGADPDPEEVLRALVEIGRRHPRAVEAGAAAWEQAFRQKAADPAEGPCVAALLCLNPSAERIPLYRSMLDSALEDVRLAALDALAEVGDAGAAEAIRARLEKACTPLERARALRALARADGGSTLERWASDPDPERRLAAAEASLDAGRPDLWERLVGDPDPRVAVAASDKLDRAGGGAVPVEHLERALLNCRVPLVFQRVCQALGLRGDTESAPALIACLGREPWRVPPAAQALKALRARGELRWALLPERAREDLARALRTLPLDPPVVQLVGVLVQELPADVLEGLRERLRALADPRARSRPSVGQAVYLAVVGRLNALRVRERVCREVEGILERLERGPGARPDELQALVRLWVRPDVELPEDLCRRVEERLRAVAEDRGAHIVCRREAILGLGRRGSPACLPLLVRLRAHPTEAISAAARQAVEEIARRHPAADPSAAFEGGEGAGPTVLVAEDEARVRTLYQRYLLQKGFQALGAADGLQALEILEQVPVDVLVLDLEMPRLDGFALLQALGPRRPRVLVVTAHGDRGTVTRALRAGIDDLLVKPVDLERLVERVMRLVAR